MSHSEWNQNLNPANVQSQHAGIEQSVFLWQWNPHTVGGEWVRQSPTRLSDEDVERIAAAVVAKLRATEAR